MEKVGQFGAKWREFGKNRSFLVIFPMLNSHKKNKFFPKTVSQTRFRLFNCFLFI